MKLTKTKLRRIIKEELQNILDEDNAYLNPPVSKWEQSRAAEEEAEKAGGQSGAVYKGSLEEEELEEEEKPSAGLSKKKKSEVAEKARKGKDIGKKGKGFEKVAKKAAKKYGSKEAGERVAAAAMWKNIKR